MITFKSIPCPHVNEFIWQPETLSVDRWTQWVRNCSKRVWWSFMRFENMEDSFVAQYIPRKHAWVNETKIPFQICFATGEELLQLKNVHFAWYAFMFQLVTQTFVYYIKRKKLGTGALISSISQKCGQFFFC